MGNQSSETEHEATTKTKSNKRQHRSSSEKQVEVLKTGRCYQLALLFCFHSGNLCASEPGSEICVLMLMCSSTNVKVTVSFPGKLVSCLEFLSVHDFVGFVVEVVCVLSCNPVIFPLLPIYTPTSAWLRNLGVAAFFHVTTFLAVLLLAVAAPHLPIMSVTATTRLISMIWFILVLWNMGRK